MRKTQKLVLGFVAACVVIAVGAPVASAIDPKYTQYAGCPNTPDVLECIRAETKGGHIQIGATDVPITKTMTLSGGLALDPVKGSPFTVMSFTSQGGLLGDPLEVPGGLTGLTGLSEFVLNLITFGANRVYAKAEVVGSPKLNLGTADLTLPLKVNLQNPFLKKGCAIGSAASPVVLNLTTGTTSPPAPAKPITGNPGVFGVDPTDPNQFLITGVKEVDNAFAAPAASGCDLIGLGLINAIVNLRVGLPSAAGKNEAVQDKTTIRLIEKGLVYP